MRKTAVLCGRTRAAQDALVPRRRQKPEQATSANQFRTSAFANRACACGCCPTPRCWARSSLREAALYTFGLLSPAPTGWLPPNSPTCAELHREGSRPVVLCEFGECLHTRHRRSLARCGAGARAARWRESGVGDRKVSECQRADLFYCFIAENSKRSRSDLRRDEEINTAETRSNSSL